MASFVSTSDTTQQGQAATSEGSQIDQDTTATSDVTCVERAPYIWSVYGKSAGTYVV